MTSTLRDMRKKQGSTLQKMSNLLGLKTASAYYKKEIGAVPLSLEEAKILSDYFNKPLEKFLHLNSPNRIEKL